MNQTYFEWYDFDVNIVLILITLNESEYLIFDIVDSLLPCGMTDYRLQYFIFIIITKIITKIIIISCNYNYCNYNLNLIYYSNGARNNIIKICVTIDR